MVSYGFPSRVTTPTEGLSPDETTPTEVPPLDEATPTGMHPPDDGPYDTVSRSGGKVDKLL